MLLNLPSSVQLEAHHAACFIENQEGILSQLYTRRLMLDLLASNYIMALFDDPSEL